MTYLGPLCYMTHMGVYFVDSYITMGPAAHTAELERYAFMDAFDLAVYGLAVYGD